MPTSLAETEICPRLHLWEGSGVWEADLNLICSSPIVNSLQKREKKKREKTIRCILSQDVVCKAKRPLWNPKLWCFPLTSCEPVTARDPHLSLAPDGPDELRGEFFSHWKKTTERGEKQCLLCGTGKEQELRSWKMACTPSKQDWGGPRSCSWPEQQSHPPLNKT